MEDSIKLSTTVFQPAARVSGGETAGSLQRRYEALLRGSSVSWTTHYRLVRRLGAGGQGVVFLADRVGSHNLSLRVALKMFSPSNFPDEASYLEEMSRVAAVAMRIAEIQQDHLLDVHNFVQCDGVQIMVTEWVDGFDLRYLLMPERLEELRRRVDRKRFEYINDVIVTRGPSSLRLKPGVAIAILRDCLAALDSMYQANIMHGDIKPSNIMLKRTGRTKLIDFGSSFEGTEVPRRWAWTPHYAPLELLRHGEYTNQSDLASLGYVLVEMLAGVLPFGGMTDLDALCRAKESLPHRLEQVLPPDVMRNDLLVRLIRRLIDPDPVQRFPSANAADLTEGGAASFHRQLVLSDLASEYHHEMSLWLQELSDRAADEGRLDAAAR
ncbi:MAG TPA: serine/threonine protein kinase [Planctomycetaceae bacterium]|nr:serine/threonine protein kinase [Planctomycetaceae bacterium]